MIANKKQKTWDSSKASIFPVAESLQTVWSKLKDAHGDADKTLALRKEVTKLLTGFVYGNAGSASRGDKWTTQEMQLLYALLRHAHEPEQVRIARLSVDTIHFNLRSPEWLLLCPPLGGENSLERCESWLMDSTMWDWSDDLTARFCIKWFRGTTIRDPAGYSVKHYVPKPGCLEFVIRLLKKRPQILNPEFMYGDARKAVHDVLASQINSWWEQNCPRTVVINHADDLLAFCIQGRVRPAFLFMMKVFDDFKEGKDRGNRTSAFNDLQPMFLSRIARAENHLCRWRLRDLALAPYSRLEQRSFGEERKKGETAEECFARLLSKWHPMSLDLKLGRRMVAQLYRTLFGHTSLCGMNCTEDGVKIKRRVVINGEERSVPRMRKARELQKRIRKDIVPADWGTPVDPRWQDNKFGGAFTFRIVAARCCPILAQYHWDRLRQHVKLAGVGGAAPKYLGDAERGQWQPWGYGWRFLECLAMSRQERTNKLAKDREFQAQIMSHEDVFEEAERAVPARLVQGQQEVRRANAQTYLDKLEKEAARTRNCLGEAGDLSEDSDTREALKFRERL